MIDAFNYDVAAPLALTAIYSGVALAAIGIGIGVLRWGLGRR